MSLINLDKEKLLMYATPRLSPSEKPLHMVVALRHLRMSNHTCYLKEIA